MMKMGDKIDFMILAFLVALGTAMIEIDSVAIFGVIIVSMSLVTLMYRVAFFIVYGSPYREVYSQQ